MTSRIAIVLALALVSLHGDDDAQGEPRLMDLNVVAVDSHQQPVNDLTSGDFQITDAGKRQKIVLFRHSDSKLWQSPPSAPNEFSNRSGANVPHATLILFDLLNERFGTRGAAWSQLVRYLQPLESADYLYLYLLTLDGRLYAVHGLRGAEGDGGLPGAPWTSQIKTIMDEAMRAVLRTRPTDIDVAVRVQLTFAALESLAVQLSMLPGRKNIVWITDGVPIGLGPRRSDTGGFVDFTPQLRQLSEAFNRSSVAIYPVRQVMLGSPDSQGGGMGIGSAETLAEFAGMTGGRPDSGKDIGGAVQQAMNDVRTSYQIGYYPPAQNWDSKFHKLRVTCTRKGVRIQAKTGYYAWPEPPGAQSRQAIEAAASTAFDAAEIGLRAILSPDRKTVHVTHLQVRIETRDIALAHEGEIYIGQLRFAVVGYLADGRAEGSPIIPLDVHYSAQERDKALVQGIDFAKDLTLGQTVQKVRFIVFDRGSNAIGSVTIPVKTAVTNP